MTVYGITKYGTDVYGLSLPPAYLATPFVAEPIDYSSIRVTWKQPSGIIFRWRLLSNRFGFPVNENDGNIIYDSLTYPASVYLDKAVIPGTYHYYAMYVLADVGDNLWVRSGIAACLMPKQFQSNEWFFDRLPEYFKINPVTGGSLTDDASGNTDLEHFLAVVGWGLDYIRTQSDLLANHLNDPKVIPLNDLWNMAAEVGLDFSPETPAAVVRKAAGNWAHVSQERGTLHGLDGEITLRTGYPADVTIGKNMVLEDDQAQFLNPIFLEYTPDKLWHVGEYCHFFGCWYRCLLPTYGIQPAGARTSNANWLFVNDEDDTLSTLLNPVTNNTSTWEALDSSAVNGIPTSPTTTTTQGIGVVNPLDSTKSDTNSLRIYNRAGTAKTLWARSVSRRTSELGFIPDPGFETGVTIPGSRRTRIQLVPGDWPILGDLFKTNPSSFWSAQNSTIARTTDVKRSGQYSLQMSALPTNMPVVTGQLTDPSFEVSVSGWTPTNCTILRTVTFAEDGGASMQITPTAVANPFVESPAVACVPGANNSASVWLMMSTTPVSLRLDLHYYDADGNALTSTHGTASTPTINVQTLYSVTAAAPANAATMRVNVVYNGTPAVTNIVYADNVFFSTPATAFGSSGVQSPWFACPAGTAVTSAAWAFSQNTLSTNVQAALQWIDSNGSVLGLTLGTASALPNTTWTQYTVSDTAPSGTAYAALALALVNGEATDVVYFDDITVTAGLTAVTNFPPELIQAVKDGIPVPWVRDSQVWNPKRRYKTNDIILNNGQPFIALRASTGIMPPTGNVASPEWAPLSQNRRIRILHSAYLSQNLSVVSDKTTQVIPFVEWFDKHGNFIARVFARNPNGSGGVVAFPDKLTFDSFTGLSLIAGTTGGTVPLGNWQTTFWNNTTMTGTPSATRQDSVVNFSFNQSPQPGVSNDGWSASWTNSFIAPTTGSYSFALTQSGGGSRLIINGLEIINNWTAGAGGSISANVSLTAGQLVNIEVDYFLQVSTGGSFGSNLLSSWSPGSVGIGHNQVSPVFPVFASAPYLFSVGLHVNNDIARGSATIAWLDLNGNLISTTTTGVLDQSSSTLNLDLEGTTPAGASQAQVTLTGQSRKGANLSVILPEFQVQSPVVGGGLGSILLSNVTAPTSVSGLQVTSTLTGRRTDDEQYSWTVPTGDWTVGGFQGGSVWPTDPSVRSLGIITGQNANGNVGITFRTAASAGNSQGVIFRYSDNNNYWRAGRTTLRKKVAGTFTTVGTYSTPFSDNDRMVVQMNGNAIKVFRNGGTQVLSVSDGFNSTATSHGIFNEAT